MVVVEPRFIPENSPDPLVNGARRAANALIHHEAEKAKVAVKGLYCDVHVPGRGLLEFRPGFGSYVIIRRGFCCSSFERKLPPAYAPPGRGLADRPYDWFTTLKMKLSSMFSKERVQYHASRWLNAILITSTVVLCAMSFVALIATLWTLMRDRDLAFHPEGFETFLSAFEKYSTLFGATIAVAVAYFGLHRWHAATEANRQKEKQDRFTEWKAALDDRFTEIVPRDPYMRRVFIRSRYELFCVLYPNDFRIDNKDALVQAFAVFADDVSFMEQQNNKHICMGGVYRDGIHSYSFDGFQYLFIPATKKQYSELRADLMSLYLAAMDPNRWIDPAMYQAAMINC